MIFLDMNPKTPATNAKINKHYYIKLKIFCTAEETIKEKKRESMEW